MKIEIKQSTCIKYLELVGKIATKHVTLPVLQCVLITVEEQKMTLRTTNLEIATEVEVETVSIESGGKIAVPAVTLLQTIQQIHAEKIVLESNEDGVLHVKTPKTTIAIKSIPAEEFPMIPKIEGEEIIVNRNQFSLGVKTVATAASQSSIKPELGSVYVYQKREHSLTFVATDSFRLMEKTVSQKDVIMNTSILIPFKNALELARFCDLLDTDPVLIVNDNQCSLSFKEVYITSRLVSGTFPDYNSIIPKEFTTKGVLLKHDIVTALKKTNIFLNKFRQVKMCVSENMIKVSSQNNDVGTISDEIPFQFEGDELELSFNQQYLSDGIPHVTDDSVVFAFAGIGRPLVISGISDKTMRYLVMPMNK